MRQQQR